MKMNHEVSDIDPQKMDSQNWDMLLALLEHPEKYSETQKDELLGDEEVNELYQQLVPQKMDSQKWDMLLDLLEHPEKYSETQKDELLGEEEVNELYQQVVETRQSLDFAKSKEKMKMPSIVAEWEKLKEEKQQKEEMNQNAETQQTAKLFPLWSPMRKVG